MFIITNLPGFYFLTVKSGTFADGKTVRDDPMHMHKSAL